MDAKTVIKIISLTTSIAGMALNLVNGWAAEKQMDAKIAEEVAKALTNATNKA